MKLWLMIGAAVVLIGAFGGTYHAGTKTGRNACQAEQAEKEEQERLAEQAQELEAQREHDTLVTQLRRKNQELEEEFERRENDYAHRIGELSNELNSQRQEQKDLEEELSGRGSSLADLRCARDASHIRRLYFNVFEESPIPPGDSEP